MFRTVLLCCVVIGLGGSATARTKTHKKPTASPSEAAAALPADEAKTYILGPGDKLNIITFDEPQLTGAFSVGANGAISLPWIGDVPAVGRTELELRDDIQARLKNGYILNPQVSLEVITFRPFYILGEVNRPGEYPYAHGLTVMSAVATAQGFTYRAEKKKVYIRHAGQSFEVKEPLTAASKVEPGDTVRIVERYF